jgi:toxin ParE1/3/4
MKRHAVCAPLAAEDLQQLSEYIAQRNPGAAKRFLKTVKRTFGNLAAFPGIGAVWEDSPIPDVRAWPLPRYKNYVIFYRPIANGVEIVRIVHGARDFPRLFKDRR